MAAKQTLPRLFSGPFTVSPFPSHLSYARRQKLELSLTLEIFLGHFCDAIPRVFTCNPLPGSVTHLCPKVRTLVQTHDCLRDFRGCLAQVKEETVQFRFDQLHILRDPARHNG